MSRAFLPVALVAIVASSAYADDAAILEALNAAKPVKPLRGLVYNEDGIAEARKQAARGMHGALVKSILQQAREWTDKPDDEVAALIPPPESVFAYGMAGDPKVEKAWPRFGREGGMCSWDRPGTVRSPHTGDIYGSAKEGEPYYDAGTGWKREDGQTFFFKGIWNSWVMDRLHEAIDNLSLAYMLTGDAAFARRGLFILDRVAALRASQPQTGNSAIDWPHQAALDEAKGFFHYMGNIANQRTIHTAYDYDLLARAPYAKEPSVAGDGKTVAENIIENYFSTYELRYLSMGALTNHGIILIANLITQGVLFGDSAMLKDGLEGLRGFFDNTINRDGDYMEVSGSYGRLGRDYGSRLIVPLTHYDSKNYPESAAMPDATTYTHGVKPGDDPRWYRTAVGMLYRLPVLGRYPQYGDMSMDRVVLLDQDNSWLAKHRSLYLRLLHWQTTRDDWKREIEALYPRAAKEEAAAYSLEDLALYGPALWMEPAAPSSASASSPSERSDFMGGKGIGILRSGTGKDARALFMRGGINSWHGHDDQMALVPYGHGMMLSGEYGYRWAGTPDYLGWGTRSIAHNTTVVNEDLPAPYLFKGFAKTISAPAASITAYMDASPAQWMEMRNPRLWAKANLKDYRRTAWLIDVGPQQYYFVDFFRVAGGRVHDYAWGAPFAKSLPGLKVEDIEPKAKKGVWTLAALGGKNLEEPWNAPGRSWGERLNGENGMVNSLPGEDLLPVSKWNPKPGNGYGMIWDVKSVQTDRDWKATWPLIDDHHFLRSHFINYDGMNAVTAMSPSMQMARPFEKVIMRRAADKGTKGLQSRFVNVSEVGKPKGWTLTEVSKAELKDAAEDTIAIRCKLSTGETDLLLSSTTGDRITPDDGVVFEGKNAFIRYDSDGYPRAIHFQEGTRLETKEITLELADAVFQASVTGLDTGQSESRLHLDRPLPKGSLPERSSAWIDSANAGANGYLHNEFLFIEDVTKSDDSGSTLLFKEQSLVLASLNLASVDEAKPVATLFWNHGLAGKVGSLSYKGRAVVPTGQGADQERPVLCLVKEVEEKKLKLTERTGLSAGQRIDILLAKPGDTFTMPATVALESQPSGEWKLRTNMPVKLSLKRGGKLLEREFPAGNHQFTPESL